MKIAVIGSGISGLSAAYYLSKKYHVDLYEKDDHFGGHSHTVEIKNNKENVAVDVGFDGMGLGDEAERLSKLLGNKRMVMMGNHGFMTVAESPAMAFDLAYYYERGCRTYLTALSTGAPLAVLSDDTAEKTACQWEDQDAHVGDHLAAIRKILDEEEPDYRH